MKIIQLVSDDFEDLELWYPVCGCVKKEPR